MDKNNKKESREKKKNSLEQIRSEQLRQTLINHTDLYIKSCEENLKKIDDVQKKNILKTQLNYFNSIKLLLTNE